MSFESAGGLSCVEDMLSLQHQIYIDVSLHAVFTGAQPVNRSAFSPPYCVATLCHSCFLLCLCFSMESEVKNKPRPEKCWAMLWVREVHQDTKSTLTGFLCEDWRGKVGCGSAVPVVFRALWV